MTQYEFNMDAFPDTLEGMPGIVVGDGNVAGQAFVACQGAQVLSWRDGSGRERLYLSPASGAMKRGAAGALEGVLADGRAHDAIRGGIPVCFPQFSGRGPLPKHGLVRVMPWTVATSGQGIRQDATLHCCDDNASRQIWPHAFSAQLHVDAGTAGLQVTLSVINTGDSVLHFTAALHTYLAVDDIRNVRLRGLAGVQYQDATDGNRLCQQQETDVTVAGELDRVYMSPPKTLWLMEQGVPALQIVQHGFEDSVVWNPGPEKAAALSDFPDAHWQRMLCVEAASVITPIQLAPGQRWQGGQTLAVSGDLP